MFTKGVYKTTLGFKAIVAQVISSAGRWWLKGAIQNGGVWFLHIWTVAGKSISGDTHFDLVRLETV